MINNPFPFSISRNPLVYSLYNIINFTSEIPPVDETEFLFDDGDLMETDNGDILITDN